MNMLLLFISRFCFTQPMKSVKRHHSGMQILAPLNSGPSQSGPPKSGKIGATLRLCHS